MQGRKLLVIGTTSRCEVLESMDLAQAFNVNLHVPALKQEEIKQVRGRGPACQELQQSKALGASTVSR
jgi:hypothetical protein